MLKECGMEQIARKDVPVPTWFAGTSSADSVDYWKEANDCVSNADGEGVYRQDKDSDAIQTAFANAQLPASERYGISQVDVYKRQGFVRACYAASMKDISEAITRMDNFLTNLRRSQGRG